MEGMPDNIWSAVGVAITGLIGGALWLRTKLSRDATAIASDRAEVDMLGRLQEENKELRASLAEVTAERNKLYRDVGEMAGSIRALEASQKLMEEHIAQLKAEISGLHGALERSGYERRTN